MKIIWSKVAEVDLEENLNYLNDEWNEKVVLDFTIETERIFEIIVQKPKAFKKFKKNIHQVPITKHITLYYRIGKDKIELIRFWNNFKKPQEIK